MVTLVILPSRIGWNTESNGSALCRTLWTSGTSLHTRLEALFPAYWCRNLENSDSVAKEGWTDMIVSDERYATLATAQTHQHVLSSRRGIEHCAQRWGVFIPASPALRTEAMLTNCLALLVVFKVYVSSRTPHESCIKTRGETSENHHPAGRLGNRNLHSSYKP